MTSGFRHITWDGAKFTVPVYNPPLTDGQMCQAEFGTGDGIKPACTLKTGHGGPWHVAEMESTNPEVAAMWPTEP